MTIHQTQWNGEKEKKNQMVTEFKARTFQQECFNAQKGTNVLHRYIQPFGLIICT